MSIARILIVEDERPINDLVKMTLELAGYETFQAYDGFEALNALQSSKYNLIVLDLMLPGIEGFEIMSHISSTPIIILTAKNGLTTKVHGLNLGADDYIVKPFEPIEFTARVKAVLRRYQSESERFTHGDVEVNFDSKTVTKKNKELKLTMKEFDLLETLIINKNIALSRSQLIEKVWGYDFEGENRTVDVHIQKIRKKLGWEDIIKTIVKKGYRLEV